MQGFAGVGGRAMSKKTKYPKYDDPTAFGQRWPAIRNAEGEFSTAFGIFEHIEEESYRMGKVKATLIRPTPESGNGFFLTIRHNNRYPTWDEIVWIRYNLIPDAAIMSMVLPNLNSYINQEDNGFKFVFTFEQKGWALDPPPVCKHCGKEMVFGDMVGVIGTFRCATDNAHYEQIDMTTWNEQHGNGFYAVVKNER